MCWYQLNKEQKLKTLKGHHVRVLLVEDDKLSQNLEKILLEECGCVVDITSNSEEKKRWQNLKMIKIITN